MSNPELGIDIENIGGKGIYRGTNSAEITYSLSQLIELGGKRSARNELADHEVTLAEAEFEASRLDLKRDVKIAYNEVVAVQEQIKLMNEQKSLANEVLDVVSKRVGAAREPLIQKSKAEITLSSITLAYEKALRELQTSKRRLALLWGESEINFELDNSTFFTISTPPKLSQNLIELKDNPDFTRLDVEIAKNRSQWRERQ